ncbi:MAG: hypothetical protein H7Z16_03840 [Pyrinomonadaceae bacterium]|nr:hypothetical protein [Pyrinomonadaceae bacterium]
MDKLLAILTQIAPIAATFAPGAGAIPEVAVAVAALLKYIRDQSGMTTDEILAQADVTLDEAEKMLLEDQIRLAGG